MTPTEKYLERYAEPEASMVQQWSQLNSGFLPGSIKKALVVPAYEEHEDFFTRLMQHPDIGGTVIIIVVNSPDQHGKANVGERSDTLSFTDAQFRTESLLSHLSAVGETLLTDNHLSLARINGPGGEAWLLLADRCSQSRIPEKMGVGLARKIGCDIALMLIAQGSIASSWIFSTDADALLPDNYFQLPCNITTCAAVHRAFEHVKPGGISTAQSLYDLSMHYYVQGLRLARSPYAFYSLGSALVVNAERYAMVRGFPKRAGGEDFYLLNKLAKVGDIHFQAGVTIQLQERESTRVPFGTGPAISKINALQNPQETFEFFHPDCFRTLRLTLLAFHNARAYFSIARVDEQALINWLSDQFHNHKVGTTAVSIMMKLGLIEHLKRNLNQHSDRKQYSYHSRTAFDGLKTLRYLHQLREQLFGSVDRRAVIAFMALHKTGGN